MGSLGGPNPIWLVSYKKRKTPCEDRDSPARWSCEDGGRVWIDATRSRGTPRVPGHHQMLARGKEALFPLAVGESMALPTAWFQTSCLQNWETIRFCCFRPPLITNSPYLHMCFYPIDATLVIMCCFIFKYVFTRPSLCASPGTLGPSFLWTLASSWLEWLSSGSCPSCSYSLPATNQSLLILLTCPGV